MAASTRAVSSSGLSLPKWQIALAIGAPVALGLGIWYYRSKKQTKKPVDNEEISLEKVVAKEEIVKSETEPALPTDPYKQAQIHKNKGNKHFKECKYPQAINCYSEAIKICPKERIQDISTFHQNRAAAYEQLKNYEVVIRDCTEALNYNSKYIKALHRRAKAHEVTKKLENCLEDITAVCILEAFQNQSSLLMADRVLKELGKEHAKEAMATRQAIVPSKHYINTFMASFCEDPIFNLIKDHQIEEDSGPFDRALDKLKQDEYNEIISLCSQEIEENGQKSMLAMLLRGTFYTLLGEHKKAISDLSTIFDNSEADSKVRVNALVKRATLKMQLGEPEDSLHDLLMAAELGSNNADVFHHRGQVYMLLDNITKAMEDFDKAVELDPNFTIALVQKLYTDYRLALSTNSSRIPSTVEAFENAIGKFPNCPECYLLYAQVLSDQQEFKKADEYFRKALEVDPHNSTAYVHRGLLQLQSEGNVESATELIQKAIDIDSKCEFAYETLGTIEVQRGNLRRAVELFDKAIPLSRTEVEVSHLFSLKDAALAQMKVAEKLGVTLPSA